MNCLVAVRDLHVTLGDNPILKGVSTNIERDRITALMGLNGSGKTTLLRALLKEIPYRGQVKFHCQHDGGPKLGHIGYVPQRLRFESQLPLTVTDLLALALDRRPLFFGVRRQVRGRIAEMLSLVGAPSELMNRPVDRLSGGELQRVLLALAMEPVPELLLLDEPAAGVDFKDQEKFYDLIARLNQEKKVSILLVSHDLSAVSRHVHHVICLRDGTIQCEGAPKDVVGGEMLQKVFGGDRGLFTHHHHNGE